ncbi:MAG: REP-associated tyrosine transposase [bacterium]
MRKPRKVIEGGRYHIVARANRGEFMLHSGEMKALFVHTLERAKAKHEFRIEMFCVMDNHFHLIVQMARGESLSRLMQWILSVFAMRYNRLHHLKGHVWYDRFKSRVIASIGQYLANIEYVVRNPVRAGIVSKATAYPWTGLQWWRIPGQRLVEPPNAVFRLRFGHLLPCALTG